jgi:hypothetical protein
MKNTIKLSPTESLVIQPNGQGVQFDVMAFGIVVASKVLDLDTVGALMFAFERAAECAESARMLASAMGRAA